MQCAFAIFLYVACPALPYFPTLPHKRHDVRKKALNVKGVLWFLYNYFFGNISLSKKKWARYEQNVYWSSCQLPVILVRF